MVDMTLIFNKLNVIKVKDVREYCNILLKDMNRYEKTDFYDLHFSTLNTITFQEHLKECHGEDNPDSVWIKEISEDYEVSEEVVSELVKCIREDLDSGEIIVL